MISKATLIVLQRRRNAILSRQEKLSLNFCNGSSAFWSIKAFCQTRYRFLLLYHVGWFEEERVLYSLFLRDFHQN